ncbi:MAG: hypothetical protein ACUVUG_03165 [Candidatus Aminicenantia bacterium]
MGELYEYFMFVPEIIAIISSRLIFNIGLIIMAMSVFMALIPALGATREELYSQLKFEK